MAAPDFAAPSICTEAAAPPRVKQQVHSSGRFTRTAARAETFADLLTGALGVYLVYGLMSLLPYSWHSQQQLQGAATTAISLGLILAFLQYWERAHRRDSGLLRIRESERALRISMQSVIILLLMSLIWNLGIPGCAFLVAMVVVPVLFLAQKHAFLLVLRKLRQREDRVARAVIYGAGDSARSLASALLESPRLGVDVAGVVENLPNEMAGQIAIMGYRGRRSIPVQSRPLTPALLASFRANLLLLSAVDLSPEQSAAALHAASQAGVNVRFLYNPASHFDCQLEHDNLDGVLLSSKVRPRGSWLYSAVKRITDLLLSTLLLVFLAPLLLLIAFLIRFDSPGPALFVQKRVGRDGVLFDMYKFRSMYASTLQYEVSPTSSRDIRITGIGRFLRRTSLDELPQLINVLRGEMSLVGPRPEMAFIVEGYDQIQRQRLGVIPGITGLWQLSADRAFPIHDNVQYDLYYIRNRNIFMDLAILIHTLFFAISGGV